MILLSLLTGCDALKNGSSKPESSNNQSSSTESAKNSTSTNSMTTTSSRTSKFAPIKISASMRNASEIEESLVKCKEDAQRIETTGEIKSNENNVFHVSSLVGGRLVADYVSLGDYVKTNQRMALVENLEVMRISANYIHETHTKELEIKQSQTKLKLATANKLRLERLFNLRIAAEKDYLQAQTNFALEEASLETAIKEQDHQKEEAKALLSAYGASIDEIKDDQPIRFSPIRCPKSGFIVKKNITIGDVINSSEPLYVVSDLSKVWLDITIFDRDLVAVKEGANVTFSTDSIPNHQFKAHIDYIKPLAQDSRTFVARAVLPNPQLLLKPGMFGHVEIEESMHKQLPFIPAQAIQEIDGNKIVFVCLGENTYKPIRVVLGRSSANGFFVNEGLKAGQTIVCKGSYFIKEQLSNDPSEGVPN